MGGTEKKTTANTYSDNASAYHSQANQYKTFFCGVSHVVVLMLIVVWIGGDTIGIMMIDMFYSVHCSPLSFAI
jgi:hypothetical protein